MLNCRQRENNLATLENQGEIVMAKQIVAGDQYDRITGKLFEIGRQLRQPNGYPFNAELLDSYLQDAIEGRFRLPDGFRETGELTLQIPAQARPTLEQLKSKWSWIESIERDTSPIEAVTLKLGTILLGNEKSVNGQKYEERIAPKLDIILGFQQAVWLVEHQDEFPEFMALLGKVYIDFTGLIVVYSNGDRDYPYLIQHGKRWCLGWRWVGGGFRSSGRIAFSSK
jgi:hypothetical protein